MKQSFDIKKLKLYLLLGLGFLMFRLISDLITDFETFLPRIFNNIWLVVYVTALNFILFEYTVPFIGKKRTSVLFNILIAIPLIWVHLLLYSYGLYGWRELGIWLHLFTPLKSWDTSGHAAESHMAYSAASLFFFGIIRHIYYYVKLKQSAQQLRIEKQEAELNYLKSQTNPHFLFNTLNNIYSLSRDKNDLAPESILRLSKILRYMLYEAGGNFIAVEQELKIITDYIELEKLRYDESLRVNFNYDVEDMKQAVPPLLLIPLVENAFKHGVSETRGHPFIDIHLSIKNRQLKFVVKNSTEGIIEGRVIKENIGLSNLRRQLELLYTDYHLSLEETKTTFTAILKINLASHV
jgi:hypothetical protein